MRQGCAVTGPHPSRPILRPPFSGVRPPKKVPSRLTGRTGLAVALIGASILIIAAAQRGWLAPVQGGLLAPLVPLQAFVARQFNSLYNAFNASADVQELRARNAELEKQLADLTAENIRLREVEAQYRIIAALLDYARSNPGQRYLTADVVGRDASLFLRFVLLNKGALDGVQRGMPVVTDKGLVGLITEVTPNAGKVLLITDASAAVNVRVQESRAEGVVSGQESGELRLNFISIDVDLKPGDHIVTSGLGGQFPPDILVGTVASVRKRTFDVFQEADVKSGVDFKRLETVLIITNFEPPALAPLIGTPAPTP